MQIDFNKLNGLTDICIISSKEYAHLVQGVYDKIQYFNKLLNIYILSSDDIICSLKHQKFDLSIILGVECPEHKFKNSINYKITLSDCELNEIKKYKSVVYDSLYSLPSIWKLEDEILIVSKNINFCNYYSKKYNCKFLYNLSEMTKMEFLSKRINLAEMCKHNKMFAIVFVHESYLNLAVTVQKALQQTGRYAYILHLKNVRYTRLITIEKIDTIILIDCPAFDNLEIDVSLPILTPADVQYILSNDWDGSYDQNKFAYVVPENEKNIVKYEGAGKLLLESEFFGIQYENENKILEIHEGKRGVPKEYENE